MFPQPRRTATGIDFNRMILLSTVLSRRTGLKLSDQDLIVNVIGGIKVTEPAADLGIALRLFQLDKRGVNHLYIHLLRPRLPNKT